MQNELSVQVIDRFFFALDILKNRRVIRGKATFCRMAGANRRNFWLLEKDHSRDLFQTGWLTVLVRLGVSPLWLLTGTGKIMREE